MKNKKLRNILLVVGALIAIYIATFLYQSISQMINDFGGNCDNPPANYLNLFNNNIKKRLKSEENIYHKFRDTVSGFLYDDKYNIELTKINTVANLNLAKDIIESNTQDNFVFSDGMGGVVPLYEANFQSGYKVNSTESASKIYLSLVGDSIKTVIKNDTIASYYLKLKYVCIKYFPNGVPEIKIDAENKRQAVCITFLTKRNSLYFFLLTTKLGNTNLDPVLVSKLLKQ